MAVDPVAQEFGGVSSAGPALIDVVTDRPEFAMPPKIAATEVAGFGLWAARTVMGGRGTELIALARTNALSGFFR